MAEYQMTLEYAIWEFPINVASILLPIYCERKGGESHGPNYAQEAAIKARNKARAFLQQHYTIVNDPSLPWRLGN